jgi:hypothetical protein
MRVAFLVAVSSVVVSAAVAFACSGSNNSSGDGAPPNGDDGGGTSGSSGNGTSGTGTSGSGTSGTCSSGEKAVLLWPDGGPKRASNGCLLFGTDILQGAKAENGSSGGVTWTTPEGALIPADNQYAQVTLGDDQESVPLKISGFCLDIPPKADVYGIIYELKRRTLTENGVLQTSKAAVSIPNTGFKFDDATFFWPRTLTADGGYGTHAYGQEIDSWSVNLQPSDFGPDFFMTLAVKQSTDGGAHGPIVGSVDSIRLQVWYASGTPDVCQK